MEHVKLIQGTYLFDDNADIPNDPAAGYLPNSEDHRRQAREPESRGYR